MRLPEEALRRRRGLARDQARAGNRALGTVEDARAGRETSGERFDSSPQSRAPGNQGRPRPSPRVVKKYRETLLDRIQKAGLEIAPTDERLLKEVTFFADRSDISEELTRLESHLAQFAHHLRKNEPVGRTLEFITQEISRELNTLGAKGNDARISQRVVASKAELEKIREQIQNLE